MNVTSPIHLPPILHDNWITSFHRPSTHWRHVTRPLVALLMQWVPGCVSITRWLHCRLEWCEQTITQSITITIIETSRFSWSLAWPLTFGPYKKVKVWWAIHTSLPWVCRLWWHRGQENKTDIYTAKRTRIHWRTGQQKKRTQPATIDIDNTLGSFYVCHCSINGRRFRIHPTTWQSTFNSHSLIKYFPAIINVTWQMFGPIHRPLTLPTKFAFHPCYHVGL